MECTNVDKVKPLDQLLDDQIKEFDTGRDKDCDKDLDKMIWELGDFENEEPVQAADEFEEEPPIEEELIEKKIIAGRSGMAAFRGETSEEDFFAGGDLATARSIGTEPGTKRGKTARGSARGKKKK